MSDNILIAIIAASAVVISAVCVLAGAIFSFAASNKRLDRIDNTLGVIQVDLRQFFDQIAKVKAHIKLD